MTLEALIDARIEAKLAEMRTNAVSMMAQLLETPESIRLQASTNGARWTPALLAKEVGVTTATVLRIERGEFKHERDETLATIDRIELALRVPKGTYLQAVYRMRAAYLQRKGNR